MGVGAPGAAPEGPKMGQFFKNFQNWKKMGRREGPLGANGFFYMKGCLSVPVGPILKKNGAKILIFYDFAIFLIFDPKWPQIDARGSQVGANPLYSDNYTY